MTILRETCGVLAIVGVLCTSLFLVVLGTELNKIGKIKRNTHLPDSDMSYLLSSHASDIYDRWKGGRILIAATLILGLVYALLTYTKT